MTATPEEINPIELELVSLDLKWIGIAALAGANVLGGCRFRRMADVPMKPDDRQVHLTFDEALAMTIHLGALHELLAQVSDLEVRNPPLETGWAKIAAGAAEEVANRLDAKGSFVEEQAELDQIRAELRELGR